MKTKGSEPKRPRTVPAEAVYNAKDEQWELGKRDAKGNPRGEWKHWWRTTGHLCCVAVFENGGKKRTYTRLHPDGTYSRKGIDINGAPAPNAVIYYQKSKNPTTELALTDPDYAQVFRQSVTDMPVVVFGDEGGYHVAAESLNDLLAIVGADVEPMIDSDEVSFFKTPDHEPSIEIAAFQEWLEQRGITPAKKPDAIVRKAQARQQKDFEAWLRKFS